MEKIETPPAPGSVDNSDIDLKKVHRDGDFDTLNNDEVIQAPQPKATGVDMGNLNGPIPAAHHNEGYEETEEEKIKKKDAFASGPQPGSAGPQPQKEAFNSEFHDMPEDQKTDSAEMTATAIMHTYANLKMAIPGAIAISERKLKKLDKAGEIDLSMRMRESRTSPREISLLELVQNFNESIIKPFETSQEFLDTTIPLLTTVLKEEGVAATPKQLLMFYLISDGINVAKNTVMTMGDRKEFLENIKELTANSRNVAPNGPVTPDIPGATVQHQPPPPPPPDTTAAVVSQVVDDALAKVSDTTTTKRRPGRPVGSKKIK